MASIPGTPVSEVLNGTIGTADDATLPGSLRDARFTLDAQGRWLVTTAGGGTDTLASIETLRFDDGALQLRAGTPSLVSDPGTTLHQMGGSVAALPAGGHAAAYVTTAGIDAGIYVRTYAKNGETTATTQVVPGSFGVAPDIAGLTDGRVAVAWESSTAINVALGGTTIVVAADAPGSNLFVQDADVTALAGGGFVVTYRQDNFNVSNGAQLLWAAYDAAGTRVGGDVVVPASYAGSSSVIALDNGGFAAVWSQSGSGLMLRTYGAPSATVTASTPVAVGASGAFDPGVAQLGNGNLVVTWADGSNVYLRHYAADGTPAGSAVTVDSPGVADLEQAPAIAALEGGGYLLAWVARDTDTGTSRVFVQRFAEDGLAQAPAAVVQSGPSSLLGDVNLVATTDGGYVVSLTSGAIENPGIREVYAHRFDALGFEVLGAVTGTSLGDKLTASGPESVRLNGGAGDDRLVTGTGNDQLDGGLGNDTLEGGLGDDTYFLSGADSIVDGGGIDTAVSAASITLATDIENGRLTGTAAADLHGNSLANELVGNSAANLIDGGDGPDTMFGGGGNDTYIVGAGDVVTESVGGGTDTVFASVGFTLGSNVENLQLTGAASISGTGNDLDNLLVGNDGANVLTGLGGSDTMIGGGGDDTYVVAGIDTIQEQAGGGDADRVVASTSWTLGDELEHLQLTGSGAINGTGNDLNNSMSGNAAANTLDGGAGADTMDGAGGSDTYVVDSTLDVVFDSGSGSGDVDLVRAWASHVLGFGLENLTLLGTEAIDGAGNSGANVLRGNGAANILSGGFGNDLIYGNGGNDILDGTEGSDILVGGLGDDAYLVSGSAADVREVAGQGIDTVIASVDTGYTLNAQVENLELLGGNVFGIGNELANRIIGTNGANLLNGGAGADTLVGGAGSDTYVVDHAGDSVQEDAGTGVESDLVVTSISYTLGTNIENGTLAGAATLQLTGNAGANRLIGNGGANVLRGESGNDQLIGRLGNDSLFGGNGNDALDGVEGNDLLDGGAGIDTADYRTATGAVTVRLVFTGPQATGGAGTDTLIGIESLFGSIGFGDTLVGTTEANVLRGFDGNDMLSGGGGNDRLYGDEGDDLLVDGTGNALIDGGNGFDVLSYFGAASGVVVSLEQTNWQNTLAAGTDLVLNVEGLVGSNVGHDTLTGDAENNKLTGGGGNDTLAGGDGNDTLEGGVGTDVASYRDSVFAVQVDLRSTGEQDTGGSGLDVLTGMEGVIGSAWGNDYLVGNVGANFLDGEAGADTMIGGQGGDTYVVDNAGDVIMETASVAGESDIVRSSISYTLGTEVEMLALLGTLGLNGTGNAKDNVLTGNAGGNTLNGSSGNDLLIGAGGNDVLFGGAGQDVFRFAAPLATAGVDTIRDFVAVDDRMQLDRTVFTALGPVGQLAQGAFHVGAAAAAADDRVIYNGGTGALLYDADGSGAAAAVQIATLTGAPAITYLDVFVI